MALGGGSGTLPARAGAKAKSRLASLKVKGSSNERFVAGGLKNKSSCELRIKGAAGCDTEQEHAEPGRDRPTPCALPDWQLILPPRFAIMGQVPPCMQQPQVQRDWHEAGVPGNKLRNGNHRPRATRSVHAALLITILLV